MAEVTFILILGVFICTGPFDEFNSDSVLGRFFSDAEVQSFSKLVDARPIWSKQCQKTNSSPVIAGDKVFLLERLNGKQERVRCFQLGDGKALWEHQYDAPLPLFFDDEYGWGPHSTPTIHQGKVFTVGVSGIVLATDKDQVISPASGAPGSLTVCLHSNDGSVAWRERFGGRGSLIQLHDGIVACNEKGDLEVREVQLSGSKQVFDFPSFASAPQWSSPAISENVMVIQSAECLQAWRLGKSPNADKND